MRCYLRSGMTQLSEAVSCGGRPTLELYNRYTYRKELSDLPFYSVLSRNLGSEKLQYCRRNCCLLRHRHSGDSGQGFPAPRQNAHGILSGTGTADFSGSGRRNRRVLNRLLRSEMLDSRDTVHFFFSFLEALVQDDMAFLQNFEKRLAVMEESLADTLPKELKNNVTAGRRELLVFHSYYQQLMDMCEILSENGNGFFPQEFSSHFHRLSGRIDRLYDHTQILREYALQIREMHQTQVDIRQNETMQMLTVVSTVFFPLSLLTGWYGMNFKNMPELQNPYAYFILIGLCVLIVVLEIWYFKKKGWL